jgi:hypothetical protein
MSRGNGRSNAFIDWNKRPEVIEQEIVRKAREDAIHVVKVVLPEYGSGEEAAVYRENRLGLKHQALSKKERAMMGDDLKAHFIARWSKEEIKWNLIRRIENVRW